MKTFVESRPDIGISNNVFSSKQSKKNMKYILEEALTLFSGLWRVCDPGARVESDHGKINIRVRDSDCVNLI